MLALSGCTSKKITPIGEPPKGSAWAAVTGASSPRAGVASAVADGLLYLVGGVSSVGVEKTVEFYDPGVNAWTTAESLPVALRDAAAVGRGEELIVLGGFLDAAGSKPSNRVFSLKANRWRELAPMSTARGGLAAATVKNLVYAIGGVEVGGRVGGTTEILEGTRWRDASAMPTRRSHLGVAAGERFVYAIGGRDGAPLGATERFDTATGTWERRAPMQQARAELAAVGGGSAVLAIGGAGADALATAVIETYSTGSDTWSVFTPKLPTALRAMGAGLIGAALYVAGGATAGPEAFTSGASSLPVSLQPLIG